MRIFRRRKGANAGTGKALRPRELSAFEVKLRERLNAMSRAQQYRIVIFGMVTLAAFIALRVAIFIYKLLK
jgi:hypothetical protein